jgi:hypothetical protein
LSPIHCFKRISSKAHSKELPTIAVVHIVLQKWISRLDGDGINCAHSFQLLSVHRLWGRRVDPTISEREDARWRARKESIYEIWLSCRNL